MSNAYYLHERDQQLKVVLSQKLVQYSFNERLSYQVTWEPSCREEANKPGQKINCVGNNKTGKGSLKHWGRNMYIPQDRHGTVV